MDDGDQTAPQAPPRLPGGKLYRLAWAFYLILALVAVVWIGLREGTISLALFARWPGALVDVGLGAGAGLVLIGLWALARRMLPSARRLEAELRHLLGPVESSEIFALAILSGLAEEIFFTGTAAEITPVRSVDRMNVGSGTRGSVTKAIQDIFFGIVGGKLEDRWNWLTPVALGESVAAD